MTYEEAKEAIKLKEFTILATLPRIASFSQGIEKAQEALEKAHKYRWHDLRKDSNDLPNTTRRVIVAFEDFEEKNGHKYYDVAFCGVDNLWFSYETANFCYQDEGFYVIAWREIEPFEEVKE